MEATLQAKGSDANARLQLTTTRKGVIWFDQVSLMPTDTYKVYAYPVLNFTPLCPLNNGLLCEHPNLKPNHLIMVKNVCYCDLD